MEEKEIELKDLALIGDQRTCALLHKSGSIVWYCPTRFDYPSLFASLLDQQKGGLWKLESPGLNFQKRAYLKESALLQTHFACSSGTLLLEDWMPLYSSFYGICRKLTASPERYTMHLTPRPSYSRRQPVLELTSKCHATLEFDYHLYSSHPLEVGPDYIVCQVPAGEKAWFILAEKALDEPEKLLEQSRKQTLENWRELADHINYQGPYEDQVQQALRQLRLLTYSHNGGIIAAATTSLPEVKGGERNYDYRYVWLRDAAMIVSALTRAGSDGEEERKFLSFVCSAMHRMPKPVVPMLTLDAQPAGAEQKLDFTGYKDSRPVRYGNGANNQLQLDAVGNVIIAAKVIYNQFSTREHWETIQRMANFLVDNWQKPDHGLWEETPVYQYTSSKVIAAVSLQYIASFSDNDEEKQRWKSTSDKIRQFVEDNCLTPDGAYALYPGSDAVDVSAVLFPVWGFTDADTPAMCKTIEKLDERYCRNNLYYRHLVETDSLKEGAFLAGTFWVAQYWVMRKNLKKADQILKAALRFMNEVGIMPEEGDPETGEWLGNLPQAFVLASFIGVVIDYKEEFEKEQQPESAD